MSKRKINLMSKRKINVAEFRTEYAFLKIRCAFLKLEKLNSFCSLL